MRGAWIAVLALLGSASWAADVPGSEDLEFLARYPLAQVVGFKQENVLERIYPQDSIRRISGRLRMARQISVSGELTAITYQLPDNHSGIEAFTEARLSLLEQGAELLFWCEGRECGSSSLWANEIFDRSILYGPDGQQAYLLARLPDDGDSLVALYGITRGTGRPYLQVEWLQPDAPLGEILPTPATLLHQLESAGELRLPRLADQPSADWVSLLADALGLDSTLRVSLGGRAAAAWRDALVAERVRAGRLELDDSASPGLVVKILR